jgi:hypothetical protein
MAEIRDFRRYLYPGFPSIDIRIGYDFSWEKALYKAARKDRRFHKCGVYLIFDAKETLRYIGKAIYIFDKRIWKHNVPDARYIDLVPFDDRHAHFCLALEHFLICRLKPTYNTQGKGYEIPSMSRDSIKTIVAKTKTAG